MFVEPFADRTTCLVDRDSIISYHTTSTADSGRHSALSDYSRASLASTATDASIFSLSAPSKPAKKSTTVPTAFMRTTNKPFICQTCGKECGLSQDLFRHVKTYHEIKLREFQCMYCEQSSEDLDQIESHCQRAHPAHTPSVHVLPSFEKVVRGCSFCEQPKFGLDKYLKCMESDQKKYPAMIPVPSKRLRAVLRQSKVTLRAVEQACESRQLDRDAWEQFAWDDDTCETYSRQLEYGCKEPNDTHRPGIDDIHRFVEELLTKATFESTGEPVPPVPPPKTTTRAPGNAASPLNGAGTNMAPFNVVTESQYRSNFVASPASSTQTPCPGNLYISTPRNMADEDAATYRESTVSGIERATQPSNIPAPPISDEMANAADAARHARRQKRHPSNGSNSDNRLRAKRQPMDVEPTESKWRTNDSNLAATPGQNVASPHPIAYGEGVPYASNLRSPEPNSFGTHDQQSPLAPGEAEVGTAYGFNSTINGYRYDDPSNYQDPNVFAAQQNFGHQYGGDWYSSNNQQAHGYHQLYDDDRTLKHLRYFDKQQAHHNRQNFDGPEFF